MDRQKLPEIFSEKAYVESIAKMSAGDAAKSLREKGVDITAEQLMEVHDFIMAHKEQLQNGELSEESLAEVAGGMSDAAAAVTMFSVCGAGGILVLLSFFTW